MSQITKTAKSAMILAAGTIAGVLLAGSVATTANAETVYFGYETSFREAKQMCNGMHGRIFESERGQYGCTGDLHEQKAKYKLPPPQFVLGAKGRTRIQNFTGRDFNKNIDKVGGEGGGTGGGGGGGGGSAGGPN